MRPPTVSCVTHVQAGWPNHCDNQELTPYFLRRMELTIPEGCLLWGGRMIVPQRGQEPGATWWTLGHILNEDSSTNVRLVAEFGSRH